MDVAWKYSHCVQQERCLQDSLAMRYFFVWDIWRATPECCPSSKVWGRAKVEEERQPAVAVDLGMKMDCPEEVWYEQNLAVSYFSIWAMSRTPCPNIDHPLVLSLGFGFGLRKEDGWNCYCLGVEKASVKGKYALPKELGRKIFFICPMTGAPCPKVSCQR